MKNSVDVILNIKNHHHHSPVMFRECVATRLSRGPMTNLVYNLTINRKSIDGLLEIVDLVGEDKFTELLWSLFAEGASTYLPTYLPTYCGTVEYLV